MKRIQLHNFLYQTVLICLVGIFLYFIFCGNVGVMRYLQAKQELDAKQRELVVLSGEVESLKQAIKDWQDDTFHCEKVARQDLGMGRKGELVYRWSR